LVITEFSFALRHKVLRGHIKAMSADRVVTKFAQDCAAGRWRLCPLGSDVIEASLALSSESSPPCRGRFFRVNHGLFFDNVLGVSAGPVPWE